MSQADSLAKMDKYYRELRQLDPGTPSPGAQSVLGQLARHLYETMKRLNPGASARVEWASLSEGDRRFYLLTVQSLLRRRDELLEVISRSDRAPKKTAVLRLHEGDKRVAATHRKVLAGVP